MRRKFSCIQAKLEKGGSLVFEKYQKDINDRLRTDSSGCNTANSCSDSSDAENGNNGANSGPRRGSVPRIVEPTAAAKPPFSRGGGSLRYKRDTFIRRRSWNDFGQESATAASKSNKAPSPTQPAAGPAASHQPFARHSAARSTWSAGRRAPDGFGKSVAFAEAPAAAAAGSDAEGGKRERIRSGFSKLGKRLFSK